MKLTVFVLLFHPGCFKFGIFTTVLESKYAKDVDEGGMREAVSDVHDYYVLDVLKKVRKTLHYR